MSLVEFITHDMPKSSLFLYLYLYFIAYFSQLESLEKSVRSDWFFRNMIGPLKRSLYLI